MSDEPDGIEALRRAVAPNHLVYEVTPVAPPSRSDEERRAWVQRYMEVCAAELDEVEDAIERGDLGEPISVDELKRLIREQRS